MYKREYYRKVWQELSAEKSMVFLKAKVNEIDALKSELKEIKAMLNNR